MPGAKSWIVKKIVVVNNDASARTMRLYVGGTAAANAITATAISIPAGGSWEWDDADLELETGQTIAGVGSVATQLTYTFFGDEIS